MQFSCLTTYVSNLLANVCTCVNNLCVHYTPIHVIERVTHAVLAAFCSCYAVISAVGAKHSSAVLPCKQFVNKRLTCVNNLFVHYTRTHIVRLKRTIDSARPTLPSMNNFTTVNWNSYMNWYSFVNIS